MWREIFFFLPSSNKFILNILTAIVLLGTSWEEREQLCWIVRWIKRMKFIFSLYNLTSRNFGDFSCKIYSPNIINLYNKACEYYDSKQYPKYLKQTSKPFQILYNMLNWKRKWRHTHAGHGSLEFQLWLLLFYFGFREFVLCVGFGLFLSQMKILCYF